MNNVHLIIEDAIQDGIEIHTFSSKKRALERMNLLENRYAVLSESRVASEDALQVKLYDDKNRCLVDLRYVLSELE